MKNYPDWKQLAVLAVLAVAAICVHGYHPAVEDAEIYVPGIKKALNPSLYPHNDAFFMSHARMTLFPNLVAASVKVTHLSLDRVLLIWHAFSIFLLLLGCWYLGALAFREGLARWGGVLLVASLLTIPVAGTALYLMDEYFNPRSLSTPAILFVIINAVERKYVRAFLWMAATAVIHPLMVVFGAAYAVIYLWLEARQSQGRTMGALSGVSAVLAFPFGLFPPATPAYREALNSRPYFFLLRWHWYEWLGIVGPLAILRWFQSIAHRRRETRLERMCAASVLYGLLFLAAGLVLTIPDQFANLVELQPMRSLHLVYVLLFVFAGGLLAESILKRHVWRWALLFIPLCAGMWYAQRQIFHHTAHLELPGVSSRNDWVKAFEWIRDNTPADAYFALDPQAMALAGEDQHGFRAIAERYMLADDVKDTGAVTMFPALAGQWQEQVQAQRNWPRFFAADFHALKAKFGVDWVVLQRTGISGLSCPYENDKLLVCRVE